VWLNRSGAAAPEPRPDYEITSLSQLPPLLDRAGLHQRPDR
jgi:hypothetical protein